MVRELLGDYHVIEPNALVDHITSSSRTQYRSESHHDITRDRTRCVITRFNMCVAAHIIPLCKVPAVLCFSSDYALGYSIASVLEQNLTGTIRNSMSLIQTFHKL
jgi:hypothetical protein